MTSTEPTRDTSAQRSALEGIPFITPEVEGVGGVIKKRSTDFLVEEIPLYQPAGEGEHVYLFLEKNGLPTSELVDIVARHFGVRDRAVGYAGMKDKSAVTRQVVSVHVPGRKLEDFPSLRHERVSVLWADMHTNKLRLGHLRANRFSIRIRDVDPASVVRAHRIVKLLQARGVPNLFGTQRFGHHQNNHEVGRLLMLGDDRALLDEFLAPSGLHDEAHELYRRADYDGALAATPRHLRNELKALYALSRGAAPSDAIHAIHRVQLRFFASAFQSAIFNELTARRIADHTFDTLLPGDVACKMQNGAMFDVDERTLADPDTCARLERFEISPTGPLWGPKMKRAAGEVDRVELEALRRTGVTLDAISDFSDQHGPSTPGARRPMRIPLTDPELDAGVDEHGPFIRVAFELPPGAFATIVLREIMKRDHLEANPDPNVD